MIGTVRGRWIVGSTLCALAIAAWGTWRWWFSDANRTAGATPVAINAASTAADAGFVGSEACRECHARIADSYAMHPMARSMIRIGDEQVVEDYRDRTRFEAGQGLQYWIERNDQRVVHHEVGVGRDGQQLFDQGVEVHYAIGSGRRGRSYITDRDGILFMSPISWYSEQRRWDLSPGYLPNEHPRFERRISDRCLQCHAGRLSYVAASPGADFETYAQPPFAEVGIGCERCHGPGAGHIAWRRQTGARTGSDPIVNPSRLPASRRDDVCNQCHLEGEFQTLRHGRSHGDFRPGHLVADIWTVLGSSARIDETGDTEAVHQVEQMRTSQCFIASRGKLGCTTCHDPHAMPPRERDRYFDERCLTCHQPSHCPRGMGGDPRRRNGESHSCVGCHMPPLTANNIPHTTQTDHRIRRVPGPPGTAAEKADRDERGFPELYELEESRLSEQDVELARGLYLVERAKEGSDGKLAAQAQPLLLSAYSHWQDDPRILDGLAFCSVLTGHADEATRYWLRALELAPSNAEITHSLAVQMMMRGEMTRAREFVDRSLQLDPWRHEMHRYQSRLLLARGDLAGANAAALRSLELNPSDPQAYHWLGELQRLQGDQARSRDYLLRAEDLESRHRPR